MTLIKDSAKAALAAMICLAAVSAGRGREQAAPPGQVSHDVKVTNIEVPVRVFKGNAFLDSLTKDDFEVWEDGVPQEVDAVYLVRKTSLARNEGGGPALPRTSRLFVLLFEMSEYQAEISAAMDYFFDNVIEAQDELILMTPMSTYNLKPGMFLKTSRAKVKEELLAKVRTGTTQGGSEYRSLIRELAAGLSGDGFLDQKLLLYGETMRRLENLRHVDQKKLIEFARYLKNREIQKHVFFFYQKELVPKINTRQLALLIEANQDRPDVMFDLMEKFELYNRDVTFDVRAVQEAFSDSSIAVHFLYLTKTVLPSVEFGGSASVAWRENEDSLAAAGGTVISTPPARATTIVTENEAAADLTNQVGNPRGSLALTFEEQSEDIFSAFSEIARATGGLSDSSASAAESFQRAAAATENYYLLYYRPSKAKADKVFRKIDVRVKGGGVTVTHRQGYIGG